MEEPTKHVPTAFRRSSPQSREERPPHTIAVRIGPGAEKHLNLVLAGFPPFPRSPDEKCVPVTHIMVGRATCAKEDVQSGRSGREGCLNEVESPRDPHLGRKRIPAGQVGSALRIAERGVQGRWLRRWAKARRVLLLGRRRLSS